MMSDTSQEPYYLIVEGDKRDTQKIDTGERKAIINTNRTKSTQSVKNSMNSKQRKHKLTTTLETIEECQKSCKNGD